MRIVLSNLDRDCWMFRSMLEFNTFVDLCRINMHASVSKNKQKHIISRSRTRNVLLMNLINTTISFPLCNTNIGLVKMCSITAQETLTPYIYIHPRGTDKGLYRLGSE